MTKYIYVSNPESSFQKIKRRIKMWLIRRRPKLSGRGTFEPATLASTLAVCLSEITDTSELASVGFSEFDQFLLLNIFLEEYIV